MIRVLSLTAALVLAPMAIATSASAFDGDPTTAQTAAEAALERAAADFEARMQTFRDQAEPIRADSRLSEGEREEELEALWNAYAEEVETFTTLATEHAAEIAALALASLDIDAIVAEATRTTSAVALGMARNGAWAIDDPDQVVTYGLMADYAIHAVADAMDDVEEAEGE
ncbi:MAG: hypothetical protein EON91_05350 [Brevundimonas sp.]|uniref:hypothetical protein n=1 Tax=Brevundimonas sp. TaxID=1871086 RepID=UPI001225A815|nr:hypothetical protein [Brevundimonas sp.]RZJ18426.1 MAG: hypothetical protein EON91_05350 [Brevundimonas sp.]